MNNAGLQRDAPIAEMTLEKRQTTIRVNVKGQFLCIREAAREFLRREIDPLTAAGKIICMSSVHQEIPWAGHANCAASKGGVVMFMKSVAQELAPHRIRVNAIAPGPVRTSINKEAWTTSASDYITGATIFVDGGMLLYPAFATGGERRLTEWELQWQPGNRGSNPVQSRECRVNAEAHHHQLEEL